MTEDQAKLTRCCGPEGCGIRRREDLERVRRERGQHNTDAELFAALQLAPRYCIGSACMGWRWLYAEPMCVVRGGITNQKYLVRKEDAERQGLRVVSILDASGYCGHAGPQ
jgi:hypothetical protein